MADMFAGPTEAPENSVLDAPADDDLPMMRGRYLLPDPVTGQARSWQRATNFLRAIEDSYALQKWGEARLAYGMAQRPGLVAYASTLTLDDINRDEWADIAGKAKEAASSGEAALLGTALHKLTERHDRGEVLTVPASMAKSLFSYDRAMTEAGLICRPEHIERTTVVRDLGVVGTFDRLLSGPDACKECGPDVLIIGDLKTGKNELKYGQLKAAIQFALYSRGEGLWDRREKVWQPMPPVCPHVGVMMHLPFDTAECTLLAVDLELGWRGALLCKDILDIRKTKNITRPWAER